MNFKLGKGLQSLIPNKLLGTTEKDYSLDRNSRGATVVFNIELDKIKSNPHQPRYEIKSEQLKELADSIREHGILQPLVATKVTKDTERGQDTEYYLIAGHRRLEAARLLKLPHVPVIIRNVTNLEKLQLALVENIQRADLNAIEKAAAFKRLKDEFKLSHAEIAKKMGKSREAIVNTIRLLRLPEEMQRAVLSGQISEGHARALLSVDDSEIQKNIFNKIIEDKLSVRQVEEACKMAKSMEMPLRQEAQKIALNSEWQNIAKKMQDYLGLKVLLAKSGNGGKIVIHFSGNDDLNDVFKKISRS